MDAEQTRGQYEASVSCPCCGKVFTGWGVDERDAKVIAIEKLQDHLEIGDC